MATAAKHDVHTSGGSLLVPLELIAVSKTNPRKHFHAEQDAELAASVQAHGILQPLLVRPLPSGTGYGLVAGERRYRAAEKAGLEEVPVLVRDLSDAEVLEVQVIENLQRSDLHPLEEAEGYEQLQKLHGHTVEDLAAKVGKSKAYVYARLKLTALTPEARKAFYADKLTPSTALLVARIPVPELQVDALNDVLRPNGPGSEPMSYRRAVEHIQARYMLRLADAPFRPDDAELVPAAGPCSTCPKRTGNQRELFGDVKSGDVCTDPNCFAAKREAIWARTKAAAAESGTKILDDTTAKRLFPYGSGNLVHSARYVDLAAQNYQDPKSRRWGQLLGKGADAHVVLARDPQGEVHRLVPTEQVPELLKAAGHKPAKRLGSSSGMSKRDAARAKAERAKTLLENKVRARALEEIRKRVVVPLRAEDLRLVAEALFGEMHHEARKELLGCLEATFQKGKFGYELMTPFRKILAGSSPAELAGLLVVMAISPRDYWQERKDPIAAVAKRYRVDLGRIRRDVVQAQASKKPAPAKKAAKAAK